MSKTTEAISSADSKTLLIYSPTTAEKMSFAGLMSQPFVHIYNVSISSNPGVSYDALGDYDGYQTYIGLGGGTVIDIAKYLAYRNNAKCIAIPSMLSTNVFATDKVAAIYNGNKVTELAKVPDEVIVDSELLGLSGKENLYGLVDVFSICTALEDWLIAYVNNQDEVDQEIYGEAAMILAKARNLAPVLHTLPGVYQISEIYQIVKAAGEITNKYGNGRPESGSEHIIAKEIEAIVKVPHALAVTCGIAVVSQLQNNFNRATFELDRLNMFEEVRNSKITPEILNQAILNVKPRKDRYTVINRFDLKPIAEDLVEGTQIW